MKRQGTIYLASFVDSNMENDKWEMAQASFTTSSIPLKNI